jgi:uncharacterized protein (TIGR03435 family)
MRRTTISAGILVLSCSGAFGQTPNGQPAFEVASVKLRPEQPGSQFMVMDGGPGSADPGHLRYLGIPLTGAIVEAYEVRINEISGLPKWIENDKFDIEAKVPAGTNRHELHLMLQNLLAERFHLTVHSVKKDLPYYELVVGKSGSKMRPSSSDSTTVELIPGPKGYSLKTPSMSMTYLAGVLEMGMNSRRVVDKTGLAGRYDIALDFRPIEWDLAAPDSHVGAFPNAFAAVQEQLGLKLEEKTGPRDVLVIDRLDREPTEN